jgi:hypothetical protein
MARKSCISAFALLAATTNLHAAALPNPLQNPAFFPISVWWQAANQTGHSGAYPTIAAATAAAGINIMLGQGQNWPESFGQDYGEFEAIQQNGLYLIGGINVPWSENSSNLSVASILALAQSIGAGANLLGYNAGDEPLCGGGNGSPTMAQVPTVISSIASYDPTRPVWFNETAWMTENPSWINPTCYQQSQAALQATTGAASFDMYPVTKAWWGTGYGTDYNTIPNDTLWMQGVAMQGLIHYAAPGQPRWAYIEAGGDNYGFSEQNANFSGRVSDGSSVLVSNGPTQFGPSWVGLTVSGTGIPSGTAIVSIIDKTHAQMNHAATASASSVSVTVSGGVNNSDCVETANICVVNGNEYRPTTAQVAAEVWNSIINGATGIEYFCHDMKTYSFCLGDSAAGGQAATKTFRNLRYIDTILMHHAMMLNSPTFAACSMDKLNFSTGAVTTSASCGSGTASMATSNPAVPGAMLIKSFDGALFVIAQSTRRSTSGANFTFTLPAAAARQVTVVYDSNSYYDHARTTLGAQLAANGSGQFSDAIGTYDDYQVKIYRIQ